MAGPCLSVGRFASDARYLIGKLPDATRAAIKRAEASGAFEGQEYQDAIMEFYHRHVCRMEPWPECLERSIAKFGDKVYRHMWGPSEFTISGTLKDYDRCERLKELDLPCLFTCGRYDEARPETVAYYQSLLPEAEMLVMEDASHEHHIERRSEYLEALSSFLRRAEKRPPKS